MSRNKLVVVGSLNLDYIAQVERLPTAGQTVGARGLIQRFGGKGANQAVAAARQGVTVGMIGCVGADDAGRAYRERLHAEGIDLAGLSTTRRTLTGTALIAVDRAAENLIVVAPGANGELKPAAIRAQRARIAGARVVLLQFEVPMASVIEAVRIANRAGVAVALNPSPWREGFPWGKCTLDTLIVNGGEAEAVFGLALEDLPTRPEAWIRAMAKRQIGRLLITRGARSTYCLSGPVCLEIPALKVKPVDTVGAGDAFAGTFAARLAQGEDEVSALRHATCAGALATLKRGAQEAVPTRAATERAARCLG